MSDTQCKFFIKFIKLIKFIVLKFTYKFYTFNTIFKYCRDF